jgi:hypothetical protein
MLPGRRSSVGRSAVEHSDSNILGGRTDNDCAITASAVCHAGAAAFTASDSAGLAAAIDPGRQSRPNA